MKFKQILALSFSFFAAAAQAKSVQCLVDNKKACDKCQTVAAQCGQMQNTIYLSLQEKPQSIALQIFNSKNGSEISKEVPNKNLTLSDLLQSSAKFESHLQKLYPTKQPYEKIEILQFTFSGEIAYSKTMDTAKNKTLKLADLGHTKKRGLASEAPVGKAGGVGRAKAATE